MVRHVRTSVGICEAPVSSAEEISKECVELSGTAPYWLSRGSRHTHVENCGGFKKHEYVMTMSSVFDMRKAEVFWVGGKRSLFPTDCCFPMSGQFFQRAVLPVSAVACGVSAFSVISRWILAFSWSQWSSTVRVGRDLECGVKRTRGTG